MKIMTFRNRVAAAVIFVLFPVLVLRGEGGGEPKAPDPRVKPGALFSVEFPDMPETLAMRTAKMVVFIPRDYSADRKFPLFLWLNGGAGAPGVGLPSKVTEEKGFVCVSLPLFRTEAGIQERKAAIAAGKKWAGLYLADNDAAYNWQYFKLMLDKLDELVPNLSGLHVHAGFSNGAHMTGLLINRVGDEFVDRFNAFLLVEGGRHLNIRKQMEGRPIMWAWGQISQYGKRGTIKRYASATETKMDTTTLEMEGTGHECPERFYPDFRRWLIDKVVLADTAGSVEEIEKLVRRNKYAQAMEKIGGLQGILEEYKESDKAADLLKRLAAAEGKVLKKSKKDFAWIVKAKQNSAAKLRFKILKLERFIKKYGSTQEVKEAEKLLEELRAKPTE